MKKLIPILAVILILTSCGSASNDAQAPSSIQMNSDAKSDGMEYSNNEIAIEGGEFYFEESEDVVVIDEPTSLANERVEDTVKQNSERKVIINSDVSMESKDFDNEVEFIKSQVINSGGYIENSNLSKAQGYNSNRYTSMTLKIPVGEYETVKNQILSVGKILYMQESQQDRTNEYMDTQAKLRLKTEEEKNLLEFLNKAEKIEDVIELEKRIGEVRQEIEIARSQIENIDRLAAYSTMYLDITEVLELSITFDETDSFGVRIKDAFITSLNVTIGFFEVIAIIASASVIPLAVLGFFVFIIYRAVKFFKPKNN